MRFLSVARTFLVLIMVVVALYILPYPPIVIDAPSKYYWIVLLVLALFLPLCAPLFISLKRERLFGSLFKALVAVIFIFGVVSAGAISINYWFDKTKPVIMVCEVVYKQVAPKSSQPYRLKCIHRKTDEIFSVPVELNFYNEIGLGNKIEIKVHLGALGMRWANSHQVVVPN